MAFFRFDGVIQPENRVPNKAVVKKTSLRTNRGRTCVAIRVARHFGRWGGGVELDSPFITELSAGSAMVSVMPASCSEVFAGDGSMFGQCLPVMATSTVGSLAGTPSIRIFAERTALLPVFFLFLRT